MNPLRSVLFVPASNARALAKAPTLACDALILDLEDSVAPQTKVAARDAAWRALTSGDLDDKVCIVRVNGPGTDWFADDLRMAAGIEDCAVMIPKIETAADIRVARGAVRRAGGANPLWAMIETPLALMNLPSIGEAAKEMGLEALAIGPNDLAALLRLPAESARAGLAPHLAMMILAARAHGLAAYDGVYNDVMDSEGFEKEAREGRALGFNGKTLIHPSQVEPTNSIFSASPEEIARARAVVEAFAQPGTENKGAIAVDGVMAERIHLAQARALLVREGITDLPDTEGELRQWRW